MSKISIIIPTRNRAYYLNHCIKTCIQSSDSDLEIIVSDNNSNDDTKEIVETYSSDARVKYFNTGQSISMRANFEFALSKAEGDYIIFIGDDDGVLSKGIEILRNTINDLAPDIINWKYIDYKWPHTYPVPKKSLLMIDTSYFFKSREYKDSSEILMKFCQAHFLKYKNGANLYHGCIKKSLIDELKSKTAEYFQGQNPDVYSSIANLSLGKNFIFLHQPVTIGGESEKSMGHASLGKHNHEEKEQLVSSFVDLASKDTVPFEFDPNIRSVIAMTYGALTRVNKLLYHNSLSIHHSEWRRQIFKHVSSLPSEKKLSNMQDLEDFFIRCDSTYKSGEDQSIIHSEQKLTIATRIGLKIKSLFSCFIILNNCRTIVEAAELINQTMPPQKRYTQSNKIVTFLKAFTLKFRLKLSQYRNA